MIQGLYRDEQQIQALTGEKPSWWAWISPRGGAGEGSTPAGSLLGASFQAHRLNLLPVGCLVCSRRVSSHSGQKAAREFESWVPEGCREPCLGRWRGK